MTNRPAVKLADRKYLQKLEKEGRLRGTVDEALQKRGGRARRRADYASWCGTRSLRLPRVVLAVGDDTSVRLRNLATSQHPRRQRWVHYVVATNNHKDKQLDITAESDGRYSSRCTYKKVNYVLSIRSFCVVGRHRLLYFHGDGHTAIRLPKGFYFTAFGGFLNVRSELKKYAAQSILIPTGDRLFHIGRCSKRVLRGAFEVKLMDAEEERNKGRLERKMKKTMLRLSKTKISVRCVFVGASVTLVRVPMHPDKSCVISEEI